MAIGNLSSDNFSSYDFYCQGDKLRAKKDYTEVAIATDMPAVYNSPAQPPSNIAQGGYHFEFFTDKIGSWKWDGTAWGINRVEVRGGGGGSSHAHANQAILDQITDEGSGQIITVVERSGLHTHANKDVLDDIIDTGTGTNFLADDGTYKPVGGGGSSDIVISKTLSAAAITYINTHGFVPIYVNASGDFLQADTSDSANLHQLYVVNYSSGDCTLKGSGIFQVTATFSYTVGETYYLRDDGSLNTSADADYDSAVLYVVAALGGDEYIVNFSDPRHFA